MYCTNCGAENDKKICKNCGVKQGKIHKFCKWCGNELTENATICTQCNKKVKEKSESKDINIREDIVDCYAGSDNSNNTLIKYFLLFSS